MYTVLQESFLLASDENTQLKSVISILQEELKKTKLSAQNEINKSKSQINTDSEQLLKEINKFRNSLNTTKINIETQLQKSFLLTSEETTQLTRIINALQDELENINVEKQDIKFAKTARLAASLSKNNKTYIIINCGHVLHLEDPKTCCNIIRKNL